MKKYIIAMLLCLSLVSCGSLSKFKQASSEDTNTEINSGKLTITGENSQNYILEPVDLEKPMLFRRNGITDTIFNTRLINNYTEKRIFEKDTATAKVEEKKDTTTKEKESDNTWLIIGIAGAFLLFLLLVLCIGFVFMFMYIKR